MDAATIIQQKKKHFAEALAELRTVVPHVVEVNATHEVYRPKSKR